mmetsp:Transcript_30002/g.67874  ORF Transcript_30002/g.67874 Transcript_30002/m.67874 type:complete len:181 (-) Transcript_30002:231-773(-)
MGRRRSVLRARLGGVAAEEGLFRHELNARAGNGGLHAEGEIRWDVEFAEHCEEEGSEGGDFQMFMPWVSVDGEFLINPHERTVTRLRHEITDEFGSPCQVFKLSASDFHIDLSNHLNLQPHATCILPVLDYYHHAASTFQLLPAFRVLPSVYLVPVPLLSASIHTSLFLSILTSTARRLS